MFRARHFLLMGAVALCCAAQFLVHACHRASDPLGAVGSVAMAQTPNAKKKPKGSKDAMKLAAALCVAGMEAGLGGSMAADALGQYCVDLALELLHADYDVEP